MEVEARAAEFGRRYESLRAEIAKVIVGHGEIVEGVLTCMLAGGHGLLEGVPGLGKTLLDPFLLLATQNPLEMEGSYSLPEAQLDRFPFKLLVPTPTLAELSAIVDRTTGADAPSAQPVLAAKEILEMQRLSREVLIAGH